MATTYSLEELKRFHNEALQFFFTELMLLKDAIPKISDDKLQKPAILLLSCGQTGESILYLSRRVDTFSSQTIILARAFIETITNFVYLGICNEKEYRAFMLHPFYKYYHNIGSEQISEWDTNSSDSNFKTEEEKKEKLREKAIVQEALAMFSKTKSNMNWTKRTLGQRIDAINNSGKLMDVFFTLSKMRYYSDASETLHGSLYGCTNAIGAFDPAFDFRNHDTLEKKLYKDNTCVLLHLGMLVHEAFTLISFSNDIKEIWNNSYSNRNLALNFLYLVLEKKIPGFDEEQNNEFRKFFS